jgi:CHASE2 domain-containing sensor protein
MKGKIVFIGATFTGSTFVLTPNGLKNTHEIMALSTETLLSGKFISRPDWIEKAEWGILLITLLSFLLIIPRVGLFWSASMLFIFYGTVGMASTYLWQSE